MNIKRISFGTGKFHIYRSEIVNSTFGEKEVEFSFTIHVKNKNQKTLKKLLTEHFVCSILNKLSQKTAQEH